jgi:ubiquinone/menaquinone biosynthesis C-methylase UbiE
LTLNGKLFAVRIPKEQKIHRVLDLGTGTGIWAMDFGMLVSVSLGESED